MVRSIKFSLFAGFLGLFAPFAHGSSEPQPGPDPGDAFIAGQLTAIVERELGWAAGSYRLEVEEGVATITLPEDSAVRRQRIRLLPPIDGLQGINISIGEGESSVLSPVQQEVFSVLGLTPNTTPLPIGDLFVPLIADTKQPRFSVSIRPTVTPTEEATIAAVSYGETFGFGRLPGRRPGDGLQFGLSGGLFAQFNLDTPSSDLINADYTIGVPLTYRLGRFSARLRVYHQSSHLGDEFILSTDPERINLSFESAEALFSYTYRSLRGYLGGEYLFHREPEDLEPAGVHGGIEYRGDELVWASGHVVAGLDVKRWAEHDWRADVSFKAGLEFGARRPGRRRLSVLAEYYDGFAPYGQFYSDEIHYYGVGIYLGF